MQWKIGFWPVRVLVVFQLFHKAVICQLASNQFPPNQIHFVGPLGTLKYSRYTWILNSSGLASCVALTFLSSVEFLPSHRELFDDNLRNKYLNKGNYHMDQQELTQCETPTVSSARKGKWPVFVLYLIGSRVARVLWNHLRVK